MPTLTLRDGGELFYEVEGSGPPLVLAPGLSGTGSFWQPHLAPLAERFTVINHDHRGAGRSTIARIDYSIAQMSDDVLQLMDHLGIGRAHFMGHSTGGAMGQTLALDHPERVDRLVLSATWPKTDDFLRYLFEVRSEVLRRLGPGAYLRSNALFLMPPSWVRDHADELRIGDEEAARRIPDPEVVLGRIEAILRFDRRDELGRIAAPTLVICARDDAVTPPYFSEDLARLIPGAHGVILPRGGHLCPQIMAGAFRDQVVAFLTAPRA